MGNTPKGLSQIEQYMKGLSSSDVHSLEKESLESLQVGTMSLEAYEHIQAAIRKVKSVQKVHHVAYSFNATRILTTGAAELTSSGVRVSLPAPFFLVSDYAYGANYVQTINGLIAGQGFFYLGATSSVDGKSLLLSYGNLASGSTTVETVQLSMSGINKSYLTLLNGSNISHQTLKEPTIGISNALQTGFYSQSLLKIHKSMVGAIMSDDFVPNQYAVEIAQNPLITKINEHFEIDPEKGFCFLLVPNVIAGTVSQSNGQSWTATMNCFSDDLHKTSEHYKK